MPVSTSTWTPLDPAQCGCVASTRSQLHHALQLASAFGISYVPHAADDSHTNLGWVAKLGALISRPLEHATPVRIGLRVRDLTLLVITGESIAADIPLHGVTLEQARTRVAAGLTALGLDGSRYSLARHFEIPAHPVAHGSPFDIGDGADSSLLGEVLANANAALQHVADARGGSEVRLWPHHADIATLFTVAPGRTTGAGLALGDGYYAEPYFYVNAYPSPAVDRLPRDLAGGGTWHTQEWVGAVLPLTRLDPIGAAQAAQVQSFLNSALDATTRLLRH